MTLALGELILIDKAGSIKLTIEYIVIVSVCQQYRGSTVRPKPLKIYLIHTFSHV